MTEQPISLCMVVCNEAHRLAPMVAFHRPLVSEVVIVVQQSADATLEMARELADVVIEHPAYGYCEASRQAASDAARHDVQLILDADELLTPAAIAALPELVEQAYAARSGFRLRRTTYLDGAHQWTGDAHHRLVHRANVRYLDEIHTEPQGDWGRIPTWPGLAILHTKASAEQLRDDARVNALLTTGALRDDRLRAQKLPLQHRLAAILPSAQPGWADIPGWLTPHEADHLCTLAARGGTVVEIGTYRGRSAVALGLGARAAGGHVTTFDIFSGDPAVAGSGPEDEDAAGRALAAFGLYRHVDVLRYSSADAAVWWDEPIDLLFIDGGHDYASVAADIAAWWPHLRPGATVCFHDHQHGHGDGVVRAVAELLASGRAVWRAQVDGMAEVQHAG
jgi:predicted O-methyltransferase YrrM